MKSSDQLRAALARLDRSTAKILETRGYTRDVKVQKALEEMIREQITHANTRSTTRSIR